MKLKMISIVVILALALPLYACTEDDRKPRPDDNSSQSDSNVTMENGYMVIDYFDCLTLSTIKEHVYGDGWVHRPRFSVGLKYLNYDMSNSDITDFLKSVELNYDSYAYVQNGDKVTVSISYSHETAEALKIRFKATSKTYTVAGIYTENMPLSPDELDGNSIRAAIERALSPSERILSVYCGYDEHSDAYNDRAYISCAFAIVTNGSEYYYYHIGVGEDGKSLGEAQRRKYDLGSEQGVLDEVAADYSVFGDYATYSPSKIA